MLYKLSPELSFEADETGTFHLRLGQDEWVVPPRIFMEAVAVFIAPTNLEDAIETAAPDAQVVLRDMAESGGLVPVSMPLPANRKDAYALAVNPACAQLVIYVAGNLAFPGQAINIFGTAAVYEIGDRNFLVIRDVSCEQYRNGIAQEIASFPAILDWLRGLIDGMPWVEEVHLIGMSSGGVAASILGHYLRAKSVTALGLVKTRDALGMRLGDGITWDLVELLATHNGVTTYNLIFGEHHARDAKAARELEATPGVVLRGLDTDDHDVASVLHREGKLGELLPPWRGSKAEQPWRPPANLVPHRSRGPEPQAEGHASVAGHTSTEQWETGLAFENTSWVFHELFERQVARTPNAIAVRSTDGNWTYAELNARANRIARTLRDQGVAGETPVGVSVERSAALVPALLGVLKAGAYYVALEPSLPEARLAHIVSDSKVAVVVSDAAGRSVLSGLFAGEFVDVDAVSAAGSADNLGILPDAENLAYLLYTSGTTGRPKGVSIPQRALANHAEAFALSLCALGEEAPSRTFALKASYTFDLFVSELFPPLVAGAAVAIIPPGTERQPDVLATVLRDLAVTDLWTTPTMLRLLLGAADSGHGGSVRHVYAAGEALTRETLSSLESAWGAKVWNLYGVTEMCAGQTGWCSDAERPDEAPPIGRALPNHTARLVSGAGDSLPVGEPGELVIAGVGEARGYHHLPRQTAKAFLPDAYSERAGGRVYASGDVGTWRPDGQIAYHGRADHQIQVCGVRVELSEIEGLLLKIPGVLHAVVLPVDEVAGRADALEGYLVATAAIPSHTLREALAESVAETVIPSTWHFLDEIPVNSSGKADRKALEALRQETPPFDGVLPRTPTEHKVAAIWADLLGRDQISVEAEFFDMGGSSVLVAFARRRMDEELGVNVPDSLFFERGTVAAISQYIDQIARV